MMKSIVLGYNYHISWIW